MFDIFTITKRSDGYSLEVAISRPAKAPQWQYTEADRKRRAIMRKANQELATDQFKSLNQVMLEIKRLSMEEKK